MKQIARKIRNLRTILDLTQSEFGKRVGDVPQATVSKWERGLQEPDSTHTVHIASLAGVSTHEWLGIPGIGETEPPSRQVPVVGVLQAGDWREALSYHEDDRRWIDAPLPDEFRRYDIQAFDTAGPSMNRVYPDGTVVYVASIHSYRAPESGDKVMVMRRDRNGLVEATLKEYVVSDDGRKWLWPRSYDPQHQAPLEYSKGSEEVVVTGIVVAALVLEQSRKIAKKRR